jgi:hypothetical protein
MKETTLFVSFSGGRTSAYMAKYLIDNWGHKYDFIFVFANTGQEHENTLKFIDNCDKAWGLNLFWIEAVVNPEKGKGIRHKIVSYETAARDGEPFEQQIKKEGIPNATFNQCSERLKLLPMMSFRRSLGFRAKHQAAVGIRIDEVDRVNFEAKERGELIYPLVFMRPTTKGEVIAWWSNQDFDLEVPEHLGNCVTCWKKSDRKLMTIAKNEPERFNFFARMEKEHSFKGCRREGDNEPRKFFRKYRTTKDIIATSENHFIEFKDFKPEFQPDMFYEIDELDRTSGCDDSCDIFSD